MTSNPRSANGHRRRQIIKRVLARDDLCWLCHKPVDKTLKTPHPQSPEVHEVLPVSRGGSPTDANNCVLTHRRCNQWIGNRTPDELTKKRATPRPLTTSQEW
jgi:5-methylcytosine-specific restriction endonuclease McrA